MSRFIIRVAGQAVEVTNVFDSTRDFCADYLCDPPADFVIRVTKEDVDFEREKSIRECGLGRRPTGTSTVAYLERLALQRKLADELFAYDTLLMHGSVVAVDGEAYLFTAKSGTGKSTHTRLWREAFGSRAVMVNDDKPFLRVEQGRVMACGSPWNGKHKLGENISVPLKAICILQRGAENAIEPITPQQALPMLLQQIHRPTMKENYPKYFELLDQLTSGTAFYRLQCNMDPAAAMVAYEGMQEK